MVSDCQQEEENQDRNGAQRATAIDVLRWNAELSRSLRREHTELERLIHDVMTPAFRMSSGRKDEDFPVAEVKRKRWRPVTSSLLDPLRSFGSNHEGQLIERRRPSMD